MRTNTLLFLLMLALAVASLLCGAVSIPAVEVLNALMGQAVSKASWGYIVVESRLPQTVTALLCGSGLATAGLLLQTTFRNPLAGPSILGITNGASLGVALVMLLFGGMVSLDVAGGAEGYHLGGAVAITAAAFAGSLAVIVLLLALSHVVSGSTMLLIVGIMVSYLTSSVVSLLNFLADAESLQGYVMWGMGTFGDVGLRQLPWFAAVTVAGLLLAVVQIKPLNALQLGDNYAQNLGVDIRRSRRLLLVCTGILSAACTAFCGPVACIGRAVPHIARLLTRTSDHSVLLPATILCGACVALLCNILCTMPDSTVIPLNAVTPLFGAPVILYILLRRK